MNYGEQIFSALTDVGADLVDMAEKQHFNRSPWRSALSAVACLALMAGMGFAAWHYLSPSAVQSPQPKEAAEPVMSAELPAEPEVTEEPQPTAEVPALEKDEANTQAGDSPFAKNYAQQIFQDLEQRPFYLYDPDPVSDDTPSVAVSPDGTVLVQIDSGHFEPLIDGETGEYLALMVFHLPSGAYLQEATYDIYDLDGDEILTGLSAYNIECLGNMVAVSSVQNGQYTTELYRRDTQKPFYSDLRNALITGDCIWSSPVASSSEAVWLFDGEGNLTIIEEDIDSYFGWNNATYLVITDENGQKGLMNSKGELLLPCLYTDIYDISNGYIRCADENGNYLIDLDTREVAFEWPYPILAAYPNHVIVHTEDYRYQLLDWNGSILAEADGIQAIDANNDGWPELFTLDVEDGVLFVDPESNRISVEVPSGSVWEISSTVIAATDPDGSNFRLITLDETLAPVTIATFDRAYERAYPIWENDSATGLFYASYTEDGVTRYDVLQQDGTVLLEGLSDCVSRQGDVFTVDQGTVTGLIRLDGGWLYQEEKP